MFFLTALYLADPQPTLDISWVPSFTYLMWITAFSTILAQKLPGAL